MAQGNCPKTGEFCANRGVVESIEADLAYDVDKGRLSFKSSMLTGLIFSSNSGAWGFLMHEMNRPGDEVLASDQPALLNQCRDLLAVNCVSDYCIVEDGLSAQFDLREIAAKRVAKNQAQI